MLVPQKHFDVYRDSLESKVMIVAMIIVALCILMGIVSVAQGDSASFYQHSAAWHHSI